jgi:MFS family permease
MSRVQGVDADSDGAAGRPAAATDARAGLLGYGGNFWLVFWATFALNSASNLFVLYPLQLVAFGASASVIGAVVGTWSLASLASRPAAGPLIDRAGRQRVAMWLLGLDVLVVALYLPIGALGWHVYAVRALHGAIEGTARVALFAMVFDLLPAGREGEAMAVFSTCGMGSAAIAPIVGEVLIRRFGFGPFFIAAIALTAVAAFLARLAPDDAPSTGAAAARSPEPARPGVGYAALLADARLVPLWIVTLLFALSISCRLSFVAPFAYQRGITRVAWYFTIYSVMGVGARLFGGRMMDRVGLERMLMPSFAVLGVGIAMISGTGITAVLYLAAAVGGLGHGYVYPSLSAMVIGRTQQGAMGRSSSIYQSLYDLGGMAGPYALGVIAGAYGYGPMFVVAGSLSFVGAAYFVAVEPRAFSRRLA